MFAITERLATRLVVVFLIFLFFKFVISGSLKKYTVDRAVERKAICNDGSPVIYYFRPSGTNSKAWVLYLQGGAGCYNEESCKWRWEHERNLMTSSNYSKTKTGAGVTNENCTINPAFCEDNVVLAHYCSSDWWSGNILKSEDRTYNFMGRKNIESIVEDLFTFHDLSDAESFVLAGSSAGGVGVWTNSDYIMKLVQSRCTNPVNYSVITDAGWFLEGKGLRPWPCTGNSCLVETRLKLGQTFWNLTVHEGCNRYHREYPWKCMIGHIVYQFVTARKMAVFHLFDAAQAAEDGLNSVHKVSEMTKEEKDWVFGRGEFITQTIKDLDLPGNGGVWAQGCYAHAIFNHDDLYSQTHCLDKKSPSFAVERFVKFNENPNNFDENCKSVLCNKDCPGGQ